MPTATLPTWASARKTVPGRIPCYEARSEEFYPAILQELQELYQGALGAAKDLLEEAKAGGDKAEIASAKAGVAAVPKGPNPSKPTQYWIEVAFQIAKLDLQVACGFRIEIHMTDAPEWALIKHPDPDVKKDDAGNVISTGVFKATKGLEAKRHYKALRGFIPS